VRRSIAAVLLAVFVVGVSAAPAHAGDATGLSVSITSGSSDLRAGDRVEYTATLRNGGTAEVDGRLTITVPSFVDVRDASGATQSGADASWTVTVPAGGSATKHLTGVVNEIPKGQVRVTTLVGFYLGDATEPTIRSADAATIAGVTDPAHAVGDPAPQAAPGMTWVWWAAAAALLVVAAAIILWVRRRRRA